MQPITYRRLGPDDLDLLLAVPDDLFDHPLRAELARGFLNDPLHEIVLAFDGALAVGMATGTVLLHPDKDGALFINEVGVRESHQRRGIGKGVTEALIGVARGRGCIGVWLGTETGNAPALALYRAMNGDESRGVFFVWEDIQGAT